MPGLAWRAKRNGGALESTGNFYTNPGSAGISPLALSTLGLVMDAGDIWANAEHCAEMDWAEVGPFLPIRFLDLGDAEHNAVRFFHAMPIDWDTPFSISVWMRNAIGPIARPSTFTPSTSVAQFTAVQNFTQVQVNYRLAANPQAAVQLGGVLEADDKIISDWHLFTITYDGSGLLAGLKMYVDADLPVPFDTLDALGATPFTGTPLDLVLQYGGDYANLALYSAPISSADVAAALAAGVNGDLRTLSSASQLAHYYPLQTDSVDLVGEINGDEFFDVQYGSEPSPGTVWTRVDLD
jgi:hypothetical protein